MASQALKKLSRPALACLLAALLLGSASDVQALPRPQGEDITHTVTAGEDLLSIARSYRLAPVHLLRANGLTALYTPEEGDTLTIPLRFLPPFTPPESTAIVLNLPEQMLYLFRAGRVKERWAVAIGGKEHKTPTGDFRVLDKEIDPVWEPPAWLERETMGAGPANPLGKHWLQITPGMVGIHGTNDPRTIGDVASLGCVRLYPEGIASIFGQVSVGTPVYVIYEQARVGMDAEGELVWSVFPDVYSQAAAVVQAQDGLSRARRAGHQVFLSDFEITERATGATGRVEPLLGRPITVDIADDGATYAVTRPTGHWLSPKLLSELGLRVQPGNRQADLVIEGADGKQLLVKGTEVPLNPRRLPSSSSKPLTLEGHIWEGETWVPLQLVLEYFALPHRWEPESSSLWLKPSENAL